MNEILAAVSSTAILDCSLASHHTQVCVLWQDSRGRHPRTHAFSLQKHWDNLMSSLYPISLFYLKFRRLQILTQKEPFSDVGPIIKQRHRQSDPKGGTGRRFFGFELNNNSIVLLLVLHSQSEKRLTRTHGFGMFTQIRGTPLCSALQQLKNSVKYVNLWVGEKNNCEHQRHDYAKHNLWVILSERVSKLCTAQCASTSFRHRKGDRKDTSCFFAALEDFFFQHVVETFLVISKEYMKQRFKWASTHQYAVHPLLDFIPWRTGTFYSVQGPLASSKYPFLSSQYQRVSWQIIMTLNDTCRSLFSQTPWCSLVCSCRIATSH